MGGEEEVKDGKGRFRVVDLVDGVGGGGLGGRSMGACLYPCKSASIRLRKAYGATGSAVRVS
jgi:hypothetical protein